MLQIRFETTADLINSNVFPMPLRTNVYCMKVKIDQDQVSNLQDHINT